MKIKHLLLALVSSLLLMAGLAQAAESFDIVSSHSQVQPTPQYGSGPGCIILN